MKTAKPMLSPVEAVKICLTQKYCTFKGRARRSEFWWFNLCYSILMSIPSIALQMLLSWKLAQRSALESQIYDAVFDNDKMAALQAQAEAVDATFETWMPILCIILFVVWLLTLLPAWGVAVRRLHDIGKSGWSLLIAIIPIIGSIILLIWEVKDSDQNANQYGESPKYEEVNV